MTPALLDADSPTLGCYANTWWDSGFEELVSITPPDALLSPRTSLTAKARGKAPGLPGNDGWHGYDWRNRFPSRDNVIDWRGTGAGLGLQTTRFPAVDIDVVDAPLAEAIEQMALAVLGMAPCRIGRAPKRLLLYRTNENIGKRRIEWSMPGEEKAQAVEILGKGQQCVVEGIHPGTGRPYSWGEWHPVPLGAQGLTLVTEEQVEELFAQLRNRLALVGYQVRESRENAVDRVEVVQEQLEGEINAVQAAVRAIPNTVESHPTRDDYIRMGVAIKAALPAWPGEALDIWVEWGERWEGGDNTIEMMEADWSRMRPPFSIGAQWLFDMAARYGDTSRRADLFTTEAGPPAPRPSSMIEVSKHARRRAFRLLTADELDAEPDLEWQVTGILPRRSYGEVFGASGCGKTFLVLDLALSIASGLPFLGREVLRGRVVYVAAEGRLKDRVAAWRCRHPGADLGNLRVVQAAPNLAEPREGHALLDAIREAVSGQIDLIVLDTWARVTPTADENSRQEMGAAFDLCVQLAGELDSGIVIVHHTGASKGQQDRPRGSTVVFAAVDYAWRVTNQKGDRRLECAKMRDGEEFDPYAFRLLPSGPSCVVEGGVGIHQADAFEVVELPRTATEALAVLVAHGPLRSTDWQRATGLPPRSYQNARRILVESGRVLKLGSQYVVSDDAKGANVVLNGTNESGQVVPNGPTPLRGGADGTTLQPQSENT